MTFLRQWLLGVVGAALAAALAQALTPEGTIKKVGALLGGLLLLLAAVRPVAALDPQAVAALVPDWEGLGKEASQEAGEEIMKVLIAEKTSAYIVDKGRELGVDCTAQVTVGEDASGWPVPRSVVLTGRWTQEEKEALSRIIDRELDIPPQRQIFREEEP